MNIPEHHWRFPTKKAIDSLSKRFNFQHSPDMQDWEWEVADQNRVEEFIRVYESGGLTEDECFTLMEIIIQSLEESEITLESNPALIKVLNLLDKNIGLHLYSVWYWSDVDNSLEEGSWRITPYIRSVLNRNKIRFEEG